MEDILTQILSKMPPEAKAKLQDLDMSPAQILEQKCKAANQSKPSTDEHQLDVGYHCDKCNNKGIFYYPHKGEMLAKPCACRETRKSFKHLKQSGLADEIQTKTFENFATETRIQQDVKNTAMQYTKAILHGEKDWLFLSGQSGSGKTHLCTAVSGELLRRGKSVRYMLWKNESQALKSLVNDEVRYRELVKPLLDCDVLYIDDFLKTDRGENGSTKIPHTGDLNLAFVLINGRYVSKKPTIISTEHKIDTLLEFDEAVASRIFECSKKYNALIPRGIENNYRMRI